MTQEQRSFAHRDDIVVEHAGVDGLGPLLREHGAGRRRGRAGARSAAEASLRLARGEAGTGPGPRRTRGGRRRRARPRAQSPRSACGWPPPRRRAGVRRAAAIVHAEAGAGPRTSRAATRVVVGASSARWKCDTRFAGVKCTRPSAVSADGLTVAALATHIAAADEQAASRRGASRPAARTTLGIAAVEAERAQRVHRGPLVRRQHGLRKAARGERAHLGQALARGFARIGDRAARCARPRGCRARGPHSCASAPGCRRN